MIFYYWKKRRKNQCQMQREAAWRPSSLQSQRWSRVPTLAVCMAAGSLPAIETKNWHWHPQTAAKNFLKTPRNGPKMNLFCPTFLHLKYEIIPNLYDSCKKLAWNMMQRSFVYFQGQFEKFVYILSMFVYCKSFFDFHTFWF